MLQIGDTLTTISNPFCTQIWACTLAPFFPVLAVPRQIGRVFKSIGRAGLHGLAVAHPVVVGCRNGTDAVYLDDFMRLNVVVCLSTHAHAVRLLNVLVRQPCSHCAIDYVMIPAYRSRDTTVVRMVYVYLLLWRRPKETNKDMYRRNKMYWKPVGSGQVQHIALPM